MRKTIYTITVVKLPFDKCPGQETRTWAWYSDLDEAKRAIETNSGDMQEFYYHYLVLEESPEGQWPRCKVLQWYKWKYAQNPKAPSILPVGKWEECECPEEFKGVVNWALG